MAAAFENQEPAAEVAPRFFTNLCHALAEAPGRKEDQGLLAWFGQAGLVASAHMAWEQLEEPVREGLTEGFADGVRTVAAMGRNRRPRPWTMTPSTGRYGRGEPRPGPTAPPASRAEIDALFEAVERTCPILNLLRNPQNIRAEVRHTDSSAAARLAA